MPRMKYALISMHKTSTMSATVGSLNQEVGAVIASIACRAGDTRPAYVILQSSEQSWDGNISQMCLRDCCQDADRAWLGVLQRLERLRDQARAAIEPALRFCILAGLDAALDIGEQLAEGLGAELAARPLQRMGGPFGAGDIAAREVLGECRAEACHIGFERADKPGKHVVPPGSALNALDVVDEPVIEQGAGTPVWRNWRKGAHPGIVALVLMMVP